jgi:hypothetical protein
LNHEGHDDDEGHEIRIAAAMTFVRFVIVVAFVLL